MGIVNSSGKYLFSYFIEEVNRFREILCSKNYSSEQKLEAFKGLFYVYLETEENPSLKLIMRGINEETSRRIILQNIYLKPEETL